MKTEFNSGTNQTDSAAETETVETDEIPAEMLAADNSRYELVVIAAQRSKQLTNGAQVRVDANLYKRKNTSIAVEEVRKGLITFTTTKEPRK